MIITTTMNPSIDVLYPLQEFKMDTVNRVASVFKTAGGKGLNVTRVIHELGCDVVATGVMGGHFGEFIKEKLSKEGIKHQFSPIEEEIRSSIAILHEGKQTEILESGPAVSQEEQVQFLAEFKRLVKKGSVLTISGSLPQGFPADFYQTLLRLANQEKVKVLLDTSGESLKQSLLSQNKPYLIKPNLEELQALLNRPITLADLSSFKKELNVPLFEEVEWVVVSLGAQGALIKHRTDFYRVTVPKIEAVNPVGSGDATLSGLAYAINQNAVPETIMKTGMTTGILNTLETKTGHIKLDRFDDYFSQVQVMTC